MPVITGSTLIYLVIEKKELFNTPFVYDNTYINSISRLSQAMNESDPTLQRYILHMPPKDNLPYGRVHRGKIVYWNDEKFSFGSHEYKDFIKKMFSRYCAEPEIKKVINEITSSGFSEENVQSMILRVLGL